MGKGENMMFEMLPWWLVEFHLTESELAELAKKDVRSDEVARVS